MYFALGYEEHGDLAGLLSKMKQLPLDVVRHYAAQLVAVLQYLHFSGIVHRDLKPQNILLSSDFRVKLIDFGEALVEGSADENADGSADKPDCSSDALDEEDKKQSDDDKSDFVEFRAHDEDCEEDARYKAMSEYRGTFVGTPLYVAPEMLKESMSGHFTDLWALGCIVFQMATGEVPFKGKTDFQTFDIIMKREFKWPDKLDGACKDLVDRLLVIEPMKRLGAGRPGSGCSYDDLMQHAFFEGVDWTTVGTDPVPYDQDALKELVKKKSKVDIFSADSSDADTMRQSEFSVRLEQPEDFERLFQKSVEIKRGLLMKRNPWFINQKRLFILTNQPRLMYFKDENTFRGEIILTKDTEAKKI